MMTRFDDSIWLPSGTYYTFNGFAVVGFSLCLIALGAILALVFMSVQYRERREAKRVDELAHVRERFRQWEQAKKRGPYAANDKQSGKGSR
jgi:hypothetical protein